MTKLTVNEAAATYESAMRNIPPAGPGICAVCRTFIDEEYELCYPCLSQPRSLDVVVPITYSEHLGQIHTALRGYKDGVHQQRTYAMPRVAAILWRFLELHEPCVARAAGLSDSFNIVATVPSSTPEADDKRSNFRTIVGWCEPVSARYERLLRATGEAPASREFDERRYAANRELDDAAVLLLDDTWTRGGHAQSASAALKSAGATTVGLVVVGRHVRPEWEVPVGGPTCGELLAQLPKIFEWETCTVH